MKRTLILLGTLLALAAFAHANSIPLTSGSGTLYPLPPVSFQGFLFQFHGGGYSLVIPGGVDETGGGLVQCSPPCDPLAFPLNLNPLFTVSAPVFVLVDGDPFLSGAFTFTGVSFVSSIAPGGNLTIRYTTSLFVELALYDKATLLPVANFVWGSGEPWLVTAHFVNSSGLPGLYVFEGATFAPVPEPGTLGLMGTGMVSILFGVRRRLSRTGFRTRA
jgi:PEP-CTERM motif-containing protein